MIADGESLVIGELHIFHNHPDGFLTMPEGKGILETVGGNLLPGPPLVLDISEAGLVAADFAKVVEQGDDGDALLSVVLPGQAVELLNTGPGHVGPETVIYIQAVLAKSAGRGGVVTGAGRRLEKIGLEQEA